MVFVVDEYGTLKGLVTLSDITRPVIGEPVQGIAGGGASITKRRDGSFLIDGLRPADDLKETLGLRELPREKEESFHTVAGLVIANLQAFPQEGDSFDFGGFRFEVIDMDGQRIDKVLITPLSVARRTQARVA
jgi:putative hemolysin